MDSTPARILLVDDNRNGLIARKSILEELGYKIRTASDPLEALELFSGNDFDLVVTDYKMPAMDGLELIRRLRATRDVPIILISGFADTLGLTEAATGADAVVQKSANEVPHLLRAVTRLLKKKAAGRKSPGTSSTRMTLRAKSKGAS